MSKKSKRPYDEVSVVRALNNRRGCNIVGKTINIDEKQTDLGNGSWGKISYLVNIHKYTTVIGVVSKQYIPRERQPKNTNSSKSSHPSKIDIKSMSKTAMKNSAIR